VIENPQAAKHVSELFQDINERLMGSADKIESSCTPEEVQTYRRRVGTLVYSAFEQILVPIYKKHPDLKPPNLEI
jgi:hypothetical protein